MMHFAERSIANMPDFRSGDREAHLPLASGSIPGPACRGTIMLALGNGPVFDRAYFVDLASDGIADDQRLRRLEREADARRRSSGNNVTRLEAHRLRQL